ncbi:Asp/Glu racemase [Amycolatopsis pigmentata]|uniref:Asp/Glu racemase n=2 Tax=Amycolatopsis pigmentata TaxID=450801 RepID=A0ABW5G2N0_9PSEU
MRDPLAMVSGLNSPTLVARPTREVTREPLGAEVVLYACTACSFVGGHDGERALRAAMREAGAPRAVTTSGAVLAALAALEVRSVAVVHPYIEPVGARLAGFLREAGVDVVAARGLGLDALTVGAVDYAAVAELVAAGDHPDAEAVFVSCTALPTYDIVAPLEDQLGKPVVTANQAGLWAALHAIGFEPDGPGQRLMGVKPVRAV